MGITILRHNGIMVMPLPPSQGITIWIQKTPYVLDQKQEYMAISWAKKIGTPYVEDPRFRKNFFKDFKKALGLKGKLSLSDVDLHEASDLVQQEREQKALLTREEKKELAQQRKLVRETNKKKYGFALVDGEQVEIANYIAEPSSIFMGRGKHPLRGRWKQGPAKKDIILNLDPQAPMPEGKWKGRVWCPESLWIAKWKDKLSKRTKYVWIADTASIKQDREREKFDKALVLKSHIPRVRRYISTHLADSDLRTRKIATVCYLIDKLSLRVGDEKDEDEADTVGATTLRPEHLSFQENNVVEFSFLGKDSVPWNKKMKLPEIVVANLKEFITQLDNNHRKMAIFKGITSSNVSNFLDGVLPGLSAKVFRTFHASQIVEEYLTSHPITISEPDYKKKKIATLANLEAAKICNHMKQIPKNFNERLKKQRIRVKGYREKLQILKEKLGQENQKILLAQEKAKTPKQKKRVRERKSKFRKRSKTRLSNATTRIDKARDRLDLMKSSSQYNLTTSLKNYIDPRIFRDWGNAIDYSWENIYSASLRRKFSWLNRDCESSNQ